MSEVRTLVREHESATDVALISRLWLHEPGAADVEAAARLFAVAGASPSDLAIAYADVLLLNVFPYGSAFTDADGELHGKSSRLAVDLFDSIEFQPAELREVAGADHMGLCLAALLAIPAGDGSSRAESALLREFRGDFLNWAPVCCMAVEREPNVHAFYGALAAWTRELVVSLAPTAGAGGPADLAREDDAQEGRFGLGEGEMWLSDLLAYLLVPARSGVFLSRGRFGHMARQLGVRLPFGSRHEVARSLFSAAGEDEKVVMLLDLLAAETTAWEQAYASWSEQQPAWGGFASEWTARTSGTLQWLAQLRSQAVVAGSL